MSVGRFGATLATFLFCFAIQAPAQTNEAITDALDQDTGTYTLEGRTSLSLRFVMQEDASAKTTVGPGGVETGTSGFGGSLVLLHWLTEDVAFEFSAGGTAAETQTNVGAVGVEAKTAATVPLLAGVRYHPPATRISEIVMPYVSGQIGPFLGIETNESSGVGGVSAEAGVDVAFGGRVGLGLDVYLGPHFKLSGGFGYNAVTDFDDRVGTERNHSGAEVVFALGWVF